MPVLLTLRPLHPYACFLERKGAALAYGMACKFADTGYVMGVAVAEGIFRATMTVRIVNQGPVTLLLDSKKLF